MSLGDVQALAAAQAVVREHMIYCGVVIAIVMTNRDGDAHRWFCLQNGIKMGIALLERLRRHGCDGFVEARDSTSMSI